MAVDAGAAGEKKYTRTQYINQWKEVAKDNMQQYGIPASITLAQAILESGDGNSMLAREANNHFGIKCHGWEGKKVYKDDDRKNECFRKYRHAMESFEDHSEFLQKRRYRSLFELDPLDYKGWAKGLKRAGYATNPRYARLLINIIEKHKLYKYDEEDLVVSNTEIEDVQEESTSKSDNDILIEIDEPKREVFVHDNRIKFIVANEGDNLQAIANELEMAPWQLRKYNDLEGRTSFERNEVVFIQPKRNKSKTPFHVVEYGEDINELSQKYGIKLKKLYQYNGLSPGDRLLIGMKLWLKKPPPT